MNGETCKVTLEYISMTKTLVSISVKKRIGQSVQFLDLETGDVIIGSTTDHKEYTTLSFTIENSDYMYDESILLYNLSTKITFRKSINLDSHRASYELLRAFA